MSELLPDWEGVFVPTVSLYSGSSCHCVNPAQLAPQLCVKCDTALGTPLSHAFSVCVLVCVDCFCVCVSTGWGSGLHFYQDVCSSCPLACQQDGHSGDTGVQK